MISARTIILALFFLSLLPAAWAVESTTPIAYLAYADGYWQVWVMSEDGSNQRQVTHSPYDKHRISWYPDGLAILISGNQGELNRVEIMTGKETPVELPLKGINDAVISPDGKRIAFSLSTSDSIDDNNIWLVNADGTNEIKLTNMKGLQHQPVWSTDGKMLYFLSGSGGQVHDIWELNVATREKVQLTTASLYHFDVAVTSSNTLAFSSNRSGNYELWLRTDDGQERQLTKHPANDGKPAWSPMGDTLVFESSRTGNYELWKLDLAERVPVQLTHHKYGARAPIWYRQAIGGAS